MKYLVSTALCLIFCLNITAQQHQISLMNAFYQYKLKASEDHTKILFAARNSLDKKIIGDAYLEDWAEAILVIEEDEVYSVQARYRLFDDELQLKINGKIKAVHPHLVEGIIFKNTVFVSAPTMRESGIAHEFYELLSSGEVELLKKHSAKYKVNKAEVVELGKRETSFFYREKDEYAKPLTSSKKMLTVFYEYRDNIASYIRTNSLSFRNEKDLIMIFDFYNKR